MKTPPDRPARTLGTERRAIEVISRELLGSAGRGAGEVLLGIGDDAAVLRAPRGKLVWSIDSSLEGVHFDLSWLSLREAAARAFVAAVSDLAAMGARPIGALCALEVPPGTTRRELAAIARGQAAMAETHACPLVGGNLSRAERFGFVTTVLGVTERVLPRGGARAGQQLWLLGSVGEAAAGLRLLQAGARARDSAERACVRAWRRPRALVSEGRRLVRRASALIDISDGLASEAEHLSRSSGVAVVVDEALLRAALGDPLRRVAPRLDCDPLQLALFGGEDYALLATGPARSRPRTARVIGEVCRGAGAWLLPSTGSRRVRLRGGFDHFSRG